MRNVAVIGAGTWGIALADLLADNGHNVTVWARNEKTVNKLNATHIHDKFIDTKLNELIVFSCDLKTAILDKEMVVFAIPSNCFREVVRKSIPYVNKNTYIVTVTKGMEDETLYTMSEVVIDELKRNNINNDKVVALSGPTHAEEVIKKMPSVIVSASKNLEAAKFVQDTFMNTNFRVYTNDDIKGVELCGAFKNVIAMASGILSGLGFGDNIRAAAITRGLAEMMRVGQKFGCKTETFYGLSGIGDMIVTSTSMNSRNFRFGKLVGSGVKPSEAIEMIGMVVEGVNFVPKAMSLKEKYGIEIPITEGMNMIINEKIKPDEILKLLMTRKKKSEYGED